MRTMITTLLLLALALSSSAQTTDVKILIDKSWCDGIEFLDGINFLASQEVTGYADKLKAAGYEQRGSDDSYSKMFTNAKVTVDLSWVSQGITFELPATRKKELEQLRASLVKDYSKLGKKRNVPAKGNGSGGVMYEGKLCPDNVSYFVVVTNIDEVYHEGAEHRERWYVFRIAVVTA